MREEFIEVKLVAIAESCILVVSVHLNAVALKPSHYVTRGRHNSHKHIVL